MLLAKLEKYQLRLGVTPQVILQGSLSKEIFRVQFLQGEMRRLSFARRLDLKHDVVIVESTFHSLAGERPIE